MKHRFIASLVTAALLLSAGSTSLFAQNGPGQGQGRGGGYGGPPKSAEERVARQQACLQKNGGVCPNGGPRAECPGMGKGKGEGQGQGLRQGPRDGSGPRGKNGTCPLNNKQP